MRLAYGQFLPPDKISCHLLIAELGGYGYLREYRAEQTLRDARITAIYEGANGIHCMALAGRLLRVNNGACADAFYDYIDTIAASAGNPAAIRHGLVRWSEARQHLLGVADAGAGAHAFMQLTAQLAFQAMWIKLAQQADSSPFPERIRELMPRVFAGAQEKFDYWAALAVVTDHH